ncbi:GNAT family N-acetyltransferase [Alsobacter sp. SYSU M60028]|uniref:L-ornithine N(alpha)-acyltransferase n=2 Tax=Alsobacter ponti TaxID=2962936 RepID=A0ABT1L9F7_9HYPH|nr:GNAT family N-acyltransferase [Alsobacter ponti]MCP8938079.1 GNAT family N-acetyltransferase [Alsobacter ponti]
MLDLPVPASHDGRSRLARVVAALTAPRAVPLRARPPRPNAGIDGPLGRIGSLEVRLARSRKDIRRAQRLRYDVFFREMNAMAGAMNRLRRLDVDPFDSICDHLLVIDHAAGASRDGGAAKPRIVGTYRLLRQEVAERHFGFYTQDEFDVAPLLARHPGKRFLELGRSCVMPAYRDKRTVELLWHGIWAYVLHHRVDVMFGCASFDTLDPAALEAPLSFLREHALAAPEWRASALPHRTLDVRHAPRNEIAARRALSDLPPLIKGYLRVGASIGEGAVADRRFGTTDVLVVLPVSHINPRYIGYFGADASRHAA